MRESIEARLENEIRKFMELSKGTVNQLTGVQMRKLAKNLALLFVFNEDEDEQWYDILSLPGNLLLRTHAEVACQGQVCCVHNPSDHHMVSWDQFWDSRFHRMMRVCEHDVLHPDPDDLSFRNYVSHCRHDCDGCCTP